MATAASNPVSSRLVVLLRPADKKRLQKLAREENVSSSEIVRRSLHTYSSQIAQNESEQAQITTSLADMSDWLDKPLATIRSARLEVAENLASIKSIRAQNA